MDYNIVWKMVLDLLSVTVFSLSLLKSLMHRSIKPVLFFLPVLICIDVGINQNYHNSDSINLKLWHVVIMALPFIRIRLATRYAMNNITILAFIFFMSIAQYALYSELVVVKSLLKIIVIYIPLLFSVFLFSTLLERNEKRNALKLSFFTILILSIIQIFFYYFAGLNLFIINGFNKPSAGFSEPIWVGVFLVMIIFKIVDFEVKSMRNVFLILSLSVFGSKSSLIFSQLSFLKLRISNFIITLLFISLVFSVVYFFEIYSIYNFIDSFYIHTGNWRAAYLVFSEVDWLNFIFGLGLGGGNFYLNSSIQDIQLLQLSFDSLNGESIEFSRLYNGGDFANFIIDLVLSFGVLGTTVIVYISRRMIAKLIVDEMRLFKFFLLTSLVHPLYFMPFAIFILLISVKEELK